MAWSKWIDLALPPLDPGRDMPFDLKVNPAPGPRYPYGLRITFDHETLEKLDIDLTGAVDGAELDLRAFGHVVAFSNDDGRCTVSVQLTRIKVENEDTEDEDEGDEEGEE